MSTTTQTLTLFVSNTERPPASAILCFRQIPSNPTLKPWAYITSKGVLSGLINGGGLYPGGFKSGIKKMFRNDEIKCI